MLDRFNNKIIPEALSGCWIWAASTDKDGYGWFQLNGKACQAHRISYTIHNGEIPEGMCVLHRCDNPSCVNPKHLFLGTLKDNAQDRVQKGRSRDDTGELNPCAKLTENQVIEIINTPKTYGSGRKLASKFNTSPQNISDIRNHKRWKYLTNDM
jgi:hypothetical protein